MQMFDSPSDATTDKAGEAEQSERADFANSEYIAIALAVFLPVMMSSFDGAAAPASQAAAAPPQRQHTDPTAADPPR